MKTISNLSRMFFRLVFCATLAAAASMPASAVNYNISGSWEIDRINSGIWMFTIIIPSPPGHCQYGQFLVDVSTDFGKATMSTLLAAHAARMPLSVIDYDRDGIGNCWINWISVSKPG